MISKKKCEPIVVNSRGGLQPSSHPFSKGSIYVKAPQITLFCTP